MNRIFVTCLLFSSLLTGCVPFAWLTPPAKLEATAGVMAENSSRTNASDNLEFVVPLRAGVYPLQVVRPMDQRVFDAGIGYQLWVGSQPRWPHGPYLDLSYLKHFSDYPKLRANVALKAHALKRTFSGWGFGGSLQGGIEFVGFTNGPFESCDGDGCAFGQAYGEGSIGFYVELSRILFADGDLTYAGLGVSFRLPATFGVGFAWLDL